jgi:MFS family permease
MAVSVYLPAFLFATGEGAVLPVIPLTARHLGASAAVAGLVFALTGVGVLIFDLPSGWLISRFGEDASIAVGTSVLVPALLVSAQANSVPVLAVASLFVGFGWSVWALARLSFVASVVPIGFRGRALSTLGGMQRVGMFVGPLLGAGLISLSGITSAYYMHAVLAVCASVVMLVAMRSERVAASARPSTPGSVLGTVAANAHVFLTAGTGIALMSAVRAVRQVLIPLWALHIGLSAQAASIIFGISLGMEVLLFYPGGLMMDRLGRKPTALACLGLLSASLLILPLAHDITPFLFVAALIGIGNGIGSGIVMTLGVDFSPSAGRAQFLSAWRLCGDTGSAGGPLVAAGIVGVATLGLASVATGLVGVLTGVLILVFVPETYRRRASARRSGRRPGA